MSKLDAFSPDYLTARRRFRQSAKQLGWCTESLSIDAQGPSGEELTLDVACSGDTGVEKTLVISSGIHGVEGLFGSAVQLALLEKWATQSAPPINCVFLHGLNPYGFAWLRRCNENNVDPNRNFLLPGERYEGAPDGYARLDGLLNPPRPLSRWEPFRLKALIAIARHRMSALRQAVAAGQYEFPQGLFFGGVRPSQTHLLLKENLGRWVQGSRNVVHLDFHTGLGSKGSFKLLVDYSLSDRQQARIKNWFGADSFEACDSSRIAYDVRGGIGRWCVSSNFCSEYLYLCAEFGTYGPLQMLEGLRSENQTHHWGASSEELFLKSKQRLKELFCPAEKLWRSTVLEKSLDLVDRAVQGLAGDSGS